MHTARGFAFCLGGLAGAAIWCGSAVCGAEPMRTITIDGAFDDWAHASTYADPVDDQHDTDHDQIDDEPLYVNHPDVDLIEYKFAHDGETLYAYMKSRGVIGNTQTLDLGRAGRYYGIVTVDVDDNDETGYWLHEGGYYPTSNGYDMNMEIEWYDGLFNTGHYINHGARNADELAQAFEDQTNGFVRILPGSYDYYTQWVMFDDGSIVFVEDRGPIYQGIVTVAISPDGHEMEMAAPFRGFMHDPDGNPIVALGSVLDVSCSLEASGELAPDLTWASDTGDPIVGYYLGGPQDAPADVNHDRFTNAVDLQSVINAVLGVAGMDPALDTDVNGDGSANAIDVQMVVNAILEVGR